MQCYLRSLCRILRRNSIYSNYELNEDDYTYNDSSFQLNHDTAFKLVEPGTFIGLRRTPKGNFTLDGI